MDFYAVFHEKLLKMHPGVHKHIDAVNNESERKKVL